MQFFVRLLAMKTDTTIDHFDQMTDFVSREAKKYVLDALADRMTRVNKQWIPCLAFTGEIAFYTQASSIGADDFGQSHSGWIEFSTYFVRGELKQFELMRYDMPSSC